MNIKSIKDRKNLLGKKILLRVDFNIPVESGKIIDDFKIQRHLLTIKYLIKNNCKIIIISHYKRPKNKDKKYSLEPIAEYLSKLLKQKINFIENCVGFEVGTAVSKMNNKDILLLENLRFEAGEEKNSKIFAKHLAKLADIYVNDAFAVSHRHHASVCAIKNYLPSFAGLVLENEIDHLNKIKHPKKPLIVVLGGVKLTTKIPLIKKMQKKAYKILIGGALANNFLSAYNFEIGKSISDKKSIKIAKKIIKNENNNIIFPVDVIIGSKSDKWRPIAKTLKQVGKKDYIFDIGPNTIRLYAKYIRKANTIIWNGPLGMFEDSHYKHGTMAIGQLIASRSKGKAFGVAGGGETVEALKKSKMIKYMDWVSTGGGAMVSYLSGAKMPGLKGLI